MAFDDLNDACKGLLLTTVKTLNLAGLQYYIAGGWVPILLEPNHPALKHPGTRDVDVLMVDELENIQNAAQALLDANFRPSAKHEFQLLRDARVGQRDFVFNVDLMHPHEASQNPQLFNDIFDLGVPDAYDPKGSRFAKSIAFKSAEIVYDQELFTMKKICGSNLDEEECQVEVPILNAAAFVLSKCDSVSIPKRTRDAFDIYYILSGADGEAHGQALHALAQQFSEVNTQIEKLRDFLRGDPARFNENVSKHAGRRIKDADKTCIAAIQ